VHCDQPQAPPNRCEGVCSASFKLRCFGNPPIAMPGSSILKCCQCSATVRPKILDAQNTGNMMAERRLGIAE
jgi:hypothetical protein